MRRFMLGLVVVAALLAGCNSGPPDTSRLSDAEFNAINGASCPALSMMIENSAGRSDPRDRQYHDFAQWKYEARC